MALTIALAPQRPQIINSVDFASYGTPVGHCPKEATESNPFTRGKCDSKRSISTLEEKCLAGSTCLLLVNSEMFGGDPCPAVAVKRLVAQARARVAAARRARLLSV